jgi:hypothetical protein
MCADRKKRQRQIRSDSPTGPPPRRADAPQPPAGGRAHTGCRMPTPLTSHRRLGCGWSSLGDLKDPACVGAWLATTARRECLRVLRVAERQILLGEADRTIDDRVARRAASRGAGRRGAPPSPVAQRQAPARERPGPSAAADGRSSSCLRGDIGPAEYAHRKYRPNARASAREAATRARQCGNTHPPVRRRGVLVAMTGKLGREVAGIGVRLLDDAYMAWFVMERECEQGAARLV